MKILVTGATGAVGPRVVAALCDSGFRVRTLSIDPPPVGIWPDDVETRIGDVTDVSAVQAAMQGVDSVIHLAALLHIVNPPPALQEKYERINVGGTAIVIDAAIKAGVKCHVILVGNPDLENPASIPENELHKWDSEGVVEWWGYRENMLQILSKTHIVALPTTYGEGVPKILLEAAACGRPIVATDLPGCREIVRHGKNGFLVPPHDSKSLVSALNTLIEDPKIRRKMGARSREIVLAEFSEEIVVRQTMEVYKRISFTQRRKEKNEIG